MNLTLIILLVAAVVLFFRLMNLLGTRTGFEPDKKKPNLRVVPDVDDAEVVEEPQDTDVEDYAHDDATADALNAAKAIEPEFRVAEFLSGARSAYEFTIESFFRGDLEPIKPFTAVEIVESFQGAVDTRNEQGLRVEGKVEGLRNVQLVRAEFDRENSELSMIVDFTADVQRAVYDAEGNLVEGHKEKLEQQYDRWRFERVMGNDNPNWTLTETGEE